METTRPAPKYRHELKYEIGLAALFPLRQRLGSIMRHDAHADKSGTYTVTSLYFDNCFDKALAEKRYGLNRREKFRLRYYGEDRDLIFLEKKQKHNGLCLKSSSIISEDGPELCLKVIGSDYTELTRSEIPLVQELGIKMQTQLLRPKAMVRYTREAFIYGPGNVRITLDTDLLSCHDTGSFLSSSVSEWIPLGGAVMEVKYDEFLPDAVQQLIGNDIPHLQSFSKYARCRSIF